MKSMIIILFLLVSLDTVSQTLVGNVKRGPILIAELSVKNSETDSVHLYKLKYLDSSTDIIKSIEFKATVNKVDAFYNVLINLLQEKNGTNVDYEFENVKLNLTTQKMVGFKNILLTVNENSNFGLNGNELKKLFGK